MRVVGISGSALTRPNLRGELSILGLLTTTNLLLTGDMCLLFMLPNELHIILSATIHACALDIYDASFSAHIVATPRWQAPISHRNPTGWLAGLLTHMNGLIARVMLHV